MRSFITRFISLSACISLAACATSALPPEHHLDAGARQHINTVDAVLIAKQTQIGTDIKRNSTLSNISALASGFTPIPLLLDVGISSARKASANKAAEPMREALEGHDYAYEFRQQVKQSLAGTTLGEVESFRIMRGEYPGLRGRLISESQADAVLLVDMKYAFTPNFETLYVRSFAMLFPKLEELKPFQEKPGKDRIIEFSDNIYRNQYAVGISTGLKDAEKSEHAAHWAEMSQEKLIEALDVAALMLSDTIANDIGIDDVESDLDLIPEGYVLNTKYDNLNKTFAKTKSLGSINEAIRDTASDTQNETRPETEINGDIDVKTGS